MKFRSLVAFGTWRYGRMALLGMGPQAQAILNSHARASRHGHLSPFGCTQTESWYFGVYKPLVLVVFFSCV